MDKAIETLCNKTVGRIRLTVQMIPDYDPDLSWLGEYSNMPGNGAIDTGRGGRYLKYFNPPIENYEGAEADEIEKYCRQDFERMEGYNNNEWMMVGVLASVYVDGRKVGDASLWGIEFEYQIEDYHREIMRDEAREALTEARRFIRSLQPA